MGGVPCCLCGHYSTFAGYVNHYFWALPSIFQLALVLALVLIVELAIVSVIVALEAFPLAVGAAQEVNHIVPALVFFALELHFSLVIIIRPHLAVPRGATNVEACDLNLNAAVAASRTHLVGAAIDQDRLPLGGVNKLIASAVSSGVIHGGLGHLLVPCSMSV